MYQLLNIITFILLVSAVLTVALCRTGYGFIATSRKLRKARTTPWTFLEFLELHPSRWTKREYYRFSEEPVRSSAHRFIGRFDTAIMHWEESPILDILIEYKFPVNVLPERMQEEDCFQAGLYALAIKEYGISCSTSRLVVVYCLQDTAKRCLQNISRRDCWSCGEGRIYGRNFNPKSIRKDLERLDQVWYGRRSPQAMPTESKCRACPFSKQGECQYADI